ncbi:hypothetical protein [Planctellipticum variicoloris]|uniref:hypothetical protein n=1 Tax=Planctellipticum variicoloris TaxID=3064265 RepID=UPI002CAC3654|nr:hypothetical protein SH412_000323 [Planctomycetaceae bacterium SH412]HTN01984.1 hypothetical protein [Planctomycetaceae bacterium]
MPIAAPLPSLERLARLVEQNVRQRTNSVIYGLRVQVQDGQLVISGRTSSYYHKQLISHAALDAAEEASIRNDVEVC